jgi:hypothetical protein
VAEWSAMKRTSISFSVRLVGKVNSSSSKSPSARQSAVTTWDMVHRPPAGVAVSRDGAAEVGVRQKIKDVDQQLRGKPQGMKGVPPEDADSASPRLESARPYRRPRPSVRAPAEHDGRIGGGRGHGVQRRRGSARRALAGTV